VREVDNILDNLAKSRFRASFGLRREDIEYINKIGFSKIESHARDFVIKRLAPKNPRNDGRQTPFKGHPAFKAQHATATCCRTCLRKWHNIPENRSLKPEEIEFVINLMMEWLHRKNKI
jgi:hypothetical protein